MHLEELNDCLSRQSGAANRSLKGELAHHPCVPILETELGKHVDGCTIKRIPWPLRVRAQAGGLRTISHIVEGSGHTACLYPSTLSSTEYEIVTSLPTSPRSFCSRIPEAIAKVEGYGCNNTMSYLPQPALSATFACRSAITQDSSVNLTSSTASLQCANMDRLRFPEYNRSALATRHHARRWS